MSIHSAMLDACNAVQIVPPRYTKPGQWVQCPVKGKGASNGSGRVLVFDDGRGGICWNWATGQQQRFTIDGIAGVSEIKAPRRNPERERLEREERETIASICADIVASCQHQTHPYLARKGFPEDLGLVHAAPWRHFPASGLGQALTKAMPEGEGPWLVIPGRICGKITTVQFIGPEGAKKNILRGQMSGASHRISTGRETWVCEGIATAMTIRAALRLLGRSATVLSAFSASNVAKVASGIPGAVIAADHDKPVPTLGDMGAGQYYAIRSGCRWVMPRQIEDFNDMHQREGLRAVAITLKDAAPP